MNVIKEPGRGTIILVFGILSIAILGPFLGIPAWVMGSKDLKKIRSGLIDSSEYGTTKTGMVLGIIGTFVSIGFIILLGIAIAVAVSMMNLPSGNGNHVALPIDPSAITAIALYITPSF